MFKRSDDEKHLDKLLTICESFVIVVGLYLVSEFGVALLQRFELVFL
ncbi:unnamed protein product [Schistosoma curassoni]|uniref:Sensor histidine kinase n=1 Tax=Schistosoma curassoni TaxID=6186 RepID=A0A183L1Z0_9TREM|nr:unnamed protein product [Schistosoma curassoni]